MNVWRKIKRNFMNWKPETKDWKWVNVISVTHGTVLNSLTYTCLNSRRENGHTEYLKNMGQKISRMDQEAYPIDQEAQWTPRKINTKKTILRQYSQTAVNQRQRKILRSQRKNGILYSGDQWEGWQPTFQKHWSPTNNRMTF